MEKRLHDLIVDFERVSNVRNLDENNPIVMRISHPTNATVHVIVCSLEEPATLVLPLNVTWFVYDPQHPFYRQALRRVSKDPDPQNGDLNHTWERVDTYAEVFTHQFYDAADEAQLQDNTAPPSATPSVPGIVRLSVSASNPSNPVVVADGDPRLTDARTPLAHTHPETPATQLQTSEGVVTITGSLAPTQGMTLVALNATTAEWRKIRTSDLQ